MSRIVLGVTGASGSIYAERTAWHLKNLGHEVHLVVTEAGAQVVKHERAELLYSYAGKQYGIRDFFSEIASGSSGFSGMAVVPCSMGTLGKIAGGVSDNLLVRAADVCLKENRPLVIVPREMPCHRIHLENMLRLAEARACILPASPHFYHHPQTIPDLVDTVVAKILTHLGIENSIVPRWSAGEL
ncbi:MAG: UbiX family flavin prenyltransferase [Fibrobacter sp.]|jgi:4-hydroxy-3-polyprenylbenzoate decarboxylase|nr:UbiX family flavin prenyltransferase [Fibrobacter sp.]